MDEISIPKLKHNETGVIIEINHSPFSIGRGLCCDYVVASEVISKQHCILERQKDKWLLKDKSRNGTYINGSVMKTDTLLENEDIIALCPERQSYTFLFPSTIPMASTSAPDVDPSLSIGGDQTNVAQENSNEDVAALLNTDPELEAVLSELSASFPEVSIPPSSSFSVSTTAVQCNNVPLSVPSASSAKKQLSPRESPFIKRPRIMIEISAQLRTNTMDKKLNNIGVDQRNVEPKPVAKDSEKATLSEEVMPASQDKIEEFEDEMQCSICSEMFVKATTMNCSHTFCKYCIETWKKTRNVCPICRAEITSLNATLVLDNMIDKVIQNASDEIKKRRQQLLEERSKLQQVVTENNNRGRGGRGRGGRGRANSNTNRGGNNNVATVPIPDPVVELESTSESEDSSSESYTDSDSWTGDNDEWETELQEPYYGGYGHCYSCGRRGHWANACPNN